MRPNFMCVALLLSLSMNIYAAETDRETCPLSTETAVRQQTFVLPDNMNEWREATTKFMAPVLTTEPIQNIWEELLDLTMPKSGIIDPSAQISTARRAQTIQMSFDTLVTYTQDQRVAYIQKLVDRHKIYVNPNKS